MPTRFSLSAMLVLVALVATRLPALGAAGAGRWIPYPHVSGCYGGALCSGNGDRVAARLDPLPVLTLRFYAHDGIGERDEGRLRVRLDHHLLARAREISRDGAVIELDAVGLTGRQLHFEVLGGDEVVVEDLEVLYGLPGTTTPPEVLRGSDP